MLDKRLQLGGLQVGGPRTMQNSARFRVADNVFQTLDEYMVPRFGNKSFIDVAAIDGTISAVVHATRYNDDVFTIAINSSNEYVFIYNGVSIPGPTIVTTFSYGSGDLPSEGPQFIEKLGCLFIHFPGKGLYKFDGFQVYRTGTPLPYYQIGSTYLISPTFYLRIIQHHIDQQGNVVNSGYFDSFVRTVTSALTVRTDQGATVSTSESRPPGETPSLANEYMARFAKGISFVENFPIGEVVVTTNGDHNVKVGEYLVCSIQRQFANSILRFGFAYKVKSFNATTVTFEKPRYMSESGEWTDATGVMGYPGNPTYFSNYWLSTWTSTALTGNYVIQDIIPCMYQSAINHTFTINVASTTVPGNLAQGNLFNLSGNLGDVYAVTTVKNVFPVFSQDPSRSFCTYGDLACIAYKNEIYFSDTSDGGSFEMVNGLSFILVGEGDDGDIQAIQASSDFMLVSRQYKNYYLSGNLPTANYRPSAISQTNLGAYSNEATALCSDKIVFVNKTGVWALSSGGKCQELSFNIRGLFDTFADTKEYVEELFWNFNSYSVYASGNNQWLRLRLDVTRNLLSFLIPGDGSGKALILNLNNGEFYTWNDLLYGLTAPKIADMFSINGFYYVSGNGTGEKSVRKEDRTTGTKYDYSAGSYPPKLQTTWFTANQPSLEKKIKQIKIWGIVSASVLISYLIDWYPTAREQKTYVNSDADLFSHKQQLTPANAQACSVSLVLSSITRFEIEGLELEFEPYQKEIKR